MAARKVILASMTPLLFLVILALLLGGGGFFVGGPVIGSILGTLMLSVLVLYILGGVRVKN